MCSCVGLSVFISSCRIDSSDTPWFASRACVGRYSHGHKIVCICVLWKKSFYENGIYDIVFWLLEIYICGWKIR